MKTPPPRLTPAQLAEIQSLMDSGQKLEAIKVYRELAPHASLAEAKAFVESPTRGDPGAGLSTPPPELTPQLETELLTLLREKEVIAAVKRYREVFGGQLKDAKDAIDALSVRHGIPVKSKPCFVATAVFQDEFAPEVIALRDWRDQQLIGSVAGCIFIHIYESLGPGLAGFVDSFPMLRPALRPLLTGISRRIPRDATSDLPFHRFSEPA